MINYTDKENTLKLIEIEQISLNSTLSIQKNLNRQILTFMKNFIGNININVDFNPDNKSFKYMNESTSALNKSNKNIFYLEKLLKKLHNLATYLKKEPTNSKIDIKIKNYNKQFTAAINSIYKNTSAIEEFIHNISLIDLSELLKEVNEENKVSQEEPINEELTNIAIYSDELENSFVENTLVISEIQGKVILPYKIEKIREILLDKNEKYSSLQDVIDKLYTVPIKNYKVSSIARFKEAYKLVAKKEHGSKLKAFALASELFFNYNLHPAVITACSSLDELDIYLACLEDSTLEDFKFFAIKYEVAPVVTSNDSVEQIGTH